MWQSVILILVAVACCVQGSCYNARKTSAACVDPRTQERISVGQTKVTSECFKCSCNSDSLSCCGIGSKAGSILPPKGYKLVEDPGCRYHFEPERVHRYQSWQRYNNNYYPFK